MKFYLLILLCFHFTIPLSSVSELETDPVFLEFKNRLDLRWRIKIKKNLLTIERKEPVLVMPFTQTNVDTLKSETETEKLTRMKKFGMKMKPNIIYRFEKRWTINDLIEAEIRKEEIENKITELPEKFKIRYLLENDFSKKGSEIYIPKTKLEKRKVKGYFDEKKKLEKKIPAFPDYHFNKFSLFYISKKGVSGDYSEVSPESVLGEFIQVEKLLFKYKVKQ